MPSIVAALVPLRHAPPSASRAASIGLQHTGLGLRLQHAATPGVEEARGFVRLQERRKLGLEGLVFEELQLDLDAGVARFEVLGELVPHLEGARNLLQVEPADGRIGGSRYR